MKIAIITQGDPNNRAGFFNNVHERILHLKKYEDVEIDVYLLQYQRKFIGVCPKQKMLDGILYHVFYVKITILRYIAAFKLRLLPYPGYFAVRKYVNQFKSYDLLSVHSIGAMQIAEAVKARYGVPYVITWHGSDVHTNPQRNSKLMRLTKKVMMNADRNFFVSKALMTASDSICTSPNKEILYSGISENFREYDDSTKLALRHKHGVANKKVVAFLGNIISIKNVLVLPSVFVNVSTKLKSDDIQFWIIGDGNLYKQLKADLDKSLVDYIMFGKQPPSAIPDLMNCIDILVLPSFNEGLPLVTEEALQCGVNVVGSDVGGTSEVIGKENVFSLNDIFVENISNRIVYLLANGVKPKPLSTDFEWDTCSLRELECYRQIIKLKKNG